MTATAIEVAGVDNTYAWDLVPGADGFKRVTLFKKADSRTKPAVEVVRLVQLALDECRPEAVAVPGWGEVFSLAGLAWCAFNGVPAIMMSESTMWDERRVPWKEWMKRRLLGLCSAALAGGRPQAEYLEQLGVPRNRIFLGYDVVDNEYFSRKADEVRGQASEVRKKLGLPKRFFLASARFIEKKNLPRLLEAYARYRELASNSELRTPNSEPWHLVLLGDGALKFDLCRLISDLGLQPSVHLPGFKQYDELPVYYGLASAFIHASTTEQWGLVVNEAMASGLPVLVSNRCGCAVDLVKDGVNGFTFDPFNVEQLAQLMLRISDFRFPIFDFQKASREIISYWGPERFASGLQQAVEAALRMPPRRSSLVDRLLLRLLLFR
jgi:glycosyltransferase involved in cell wall biosynthesis